MYVSELNLAVDELVGPFERDSQLLYKKSSNISKWTCGQHLSHVLKMNMSIIDDMILLAYKEYSDFDENIHIMGRTSLFLRSIILNDDEKYKKFEPDHILTINGNWLRKICDEWESKISILNSMDNSWMEKVLPSPDSTMGYMTGENWIRYLTMNTYRHISMINKILSSKIINSDIWMDQPSDYDDLLRLKSFCLN